MKRQRKTNNNQLFYFYFTIRALLASEFYIECRSHLTTILHCRRQRHKQQRYTGQIPLHSKTFCSVASEILCTIDPIAKSMNISKFIDETQSSQARGGDLGGEDPSVPHQPGGGHTHSDADYVRVQEPGRRQAAGERGTWGVRDSCVPSLRGHAPHADAMPVQGSRRIQGGGTLVRFVTPAALVGDRDRSSWTRSSPLSL